MDYAQAGGAQHTLLLAILRLLNEYAYCVGLRNVYDFCGDGEHPSKCNARRMRTMRVNLRRTHTGADPTSPYAKRQTRHEHAARDAIRLITQFVPYRRNGGYGRIH